MKVLAPSTQPVTAQLNMHLNNLDGLRFFAAMGVFIHHMEQFKHWAGLPNLWDTFFVKHLGEEAVRFFFVLSGFLITLGFLKQRGIAGSINIPNFYRSRMLRIWPLYYLVTFLSFFVLPYSIDFSALNMGNMSDSLQQNFAPLLTYFVLFVPNLALPPDFLPVLGASQCWSLGVEEQFYLIWPILFSWFSRVPLLMCFCIVALKLVAVYACRFIHLNHIAAAFLSTFSIEAMAAGAIAAYLFHQQRNFKTAGSGALFSAPLACVITALMLDYGPLHILAIASYAVLIFWASKLPPLGGRLYKPCQALGKISYGIYMLHVTAILVCLKVLLHTGLNRSGTTMNCSLYISAFILTLVFSVCSYKFFESPFLRLKKTQKH